MCIENHDVTNAKKYLDAALANIPSSNTKERKELSIFEVELAFNLFDFSIVESLFCHFAFVIHRIETPDVPEQTRLELRCLVYLHTERQMDVCSLVESIENPSQTLLEYWMISLTQTVYILF